MITTRMIVQAVAEYRGVSMIDICSARRARQATDARHVCFWLAKQLTELSLPTIGRLIGYRDHTTVLHGVNKVERLRHLQPELNRELEEIEGILIGIDNATVALAVRTMKDCDPLVVAQRVLDTTPARRAVSQAELTQICLAIVNMDAALSEASSDVPTDPDPDLRADVEAVLDAHRQLESARYSPRERGAQAEFERALKAVQTHFEQQEQKDAAE